MIKVLKSNKFVVIFLIVICFIFVSNPEIYSKSCINALSVWAFKVLPMLFPFFVFSRIIVNLAEMKQNVLDKFFGKIYNVPNGSFLLFFLSVLSGYPMGAKLISNAYSNGQLSKNDCIKLFSFCSVSGPMFMIGTVGVGIFNSYKFGLIIFICNFIACIINGLIYRKLPTTSKLNYVSNSTKKQNFADCVYDSLNSILIVGAYIVLSFLAIDLIKNLHLLQSFLNTICSVLPINNFENIVNAVLSGILEITRGCLEISSTSLSYSIKGIIASVCIAFGGVSIMLQSLTFLKCCDIETKTFLKLKITQAILCLIVSIPICIILL